MRQQPCGCELGDKCTRSTLCAVNEAERAAREECEGEMERVAEINDARVKLAYERVSALEAALRELAELGERGMKPDYTQWLTFHDKVAQVARAALGGAP